MEDLPLIPTMKIIDYLLNKDILNLKLVNKWFYQLINENVRIKNLVISDYLPCNRRWFYNCDLINPQDSIKYDDLNKNVCFNPRKTKAAQIWTHYIQLNRIKKYLGLSRVNLHQPILSQLKQLYIYKINIDVKKLNSLDQLVHLEIINSEIQSVTDNYVLKLPMLEILNLEINSNKKCVLLVDSTKLQKLKLKLNRTRFKLVHPESIIYMEIDDYAHYLDFLPLLSNLQHFYCLRLQSVHLINFDLIQNLSNLKSIHIGPPKRSFIRLTESKKRFNKDLKIYYFNLDSDKLDELDIALIEVDSCLGGYLAEPLAILYNKYYSRLTDYCPFVEWIYYNTLEKSFKQIPEKFMDRFVNCDSFNINEKVNDLDQLIRVLKECKTITSLSLVSSLGQHFYDFRLYDLCDLCPNILSLSIDHTKNGYHALNFEFIFKFKNIRSFSVRDRLSFEFVAKLIGSHRDMSVKFVDRSFEIKIVKFEIGTYRLIVRSCITYKSNYSSHGSLDDLFDKLETICDNPRKYLK